MGRRRPLRTILILMIAGCAAACGSGTTESSRVTIQTFMFAPGTLEIPAGATVTWSNNDDILHTITSGKPKKQGVPGVSEDKPARPSGLFDNEMDGAGATFSFTFERAGAFSYYCDVHSGMSGYIIVH